MLWGVLWGPLVFLAVCVLPSAGSAAPDPDATVVDALTKFGLRGVWAADCYRPDTVENPWLKVFVSTPGLVVVEQSDEMMRIEGAFPLGSDLLALRLTTISTLGEEHGVDRLDVYRRFGARMQLYSSEVTGATDAAKRRGVVLGKTVSNGMNRYPVIVGGGYTTPPMMEQCH